MLVIKNPKLAERLEQYAKRRNESVEESVSRMLDHFDPPADPLLPSPDEMLRQINARFYAQARDYWEAHGDTERLKLSQAEFNERFHHFDADEKPIFIGDPSWDAEPEPGTMGALLKAALEADLPSVKTDIAARSREILDSEFADYLLERMGRSRGDQNAD